MNFLAHIYLSFDDAEITIGNFIADSVRGKRYENYPEKIKNGILLHRAIDTFTDSHPIARQSSKRLHENHGHYSRVIVDIFYDHFLARNWYTYSVIPLERFTTDFYKLMETNHEILPEKIQHMMPYMIAGNWLLNYQHKEGVQRVLEGMNRRAKNPSTMRFAVQDLETHYDAFQDEFTELFEELIIFSRQKIQLLCE